jgi:methyl-accepting chemotaxis protein
MLDAIVSLVDETRSQRDALMNAADHLFSDMRVVSAGDLRVNAPVSNDPIGMLANAFNFTIGRFRRFVLRAKTLSEQLSVVAHREAERAEAFSLAIQSIQASSNAQPNLTSVSDEESASAWLKKHERESQVESHTQNTQLLAHVHRAREQFKRISREGILNHTHVAEELSEQIAHTLSRLNAIAHGELTLSKQVDVATLTDIYVQELRALDSLLARIAMELHTVQKNTVIGFQYLDQDLQQLSMTLRQLKNKGDAEAVPSVIITEQDPHLQDMLRLGVTFANEVTTLSHQLTSLAQEIQNSIVSFQFEGADTLADSPLTSLASSLKTAARQKKDHLKAERGLQASGPNVRAVQDRKMEKQYLSTKQSLPPD